MHEGFVFQECIFSSDLSHFKAPNLRIIDEPTEEEAKCVFKYDVK